MGERGKRSYSQTYSNATSIYTHHTSSSNPKYRSKRLRHLAWQAFPYSYTVGAADPDELTLYDGWQSTTCGSFYLCVIKSSEPIDAWTWLDNPDVMGGGQRRDRIAVLAGNKVNIHDDVLSGKYERASGVAGGSSLLGAAAEKWKQIVPLPGGDDAVAFVAVLTEPCLQAQIRSRTEEGRGLNETLETLRSVQGQRKEKRKLKDKEGEGGDIAMDEGGESAAEHAGSSSSSSSSDAVVDLRGRIGGGGSGANAASSSLFDTLMGGITCTPASTLLLPTPPTTQSDDDDEGPTLLFLKVPVIPSTGPESQQEVLRSIPLDKKVVAMPTLLASSQTHVAIGDPWSSTLIVFRLSDDFPAVTTTEERQFQLPAGMVPRGLRVFGDHTLVCLAVEAAVAKGGGRGGEGGGAGGGATTQGGTTASFIELSLKEEEVRDELEVVGSGGGVSADSGQEQREQQQQQQQQGPADTMAFLRSFRDEMRERFDKLEGRMETLERRLSEL